MVRYSFQQIFSFRAYLDESAVFAGGALEGLGLLCAGHAVHADAAVLAGGQDVFAGPVQLHVVQGRLPDNVVDTVQTK